MTRDNLRKTFVRVRLASIWAFAELGPASPELEYSSIAALPEPGNNITVLVGGEEFTGTLVSAEQLAVRDENGRAWFIANPDIIDTGINRQKGSATNRRSRSTAAVSTAGPKAAVRVNTRQKRFTVEHATGSESVKFNVMAETPTEAREKANAQCAREYLYAQFLGLRESSSAHEAASGWQDLLERWCEAIYASMNMYEILCLHLWNRSIIMQACIN
ncbi:MAG: hypothetical protein KDI04_02710 [Halieaceae bacterium]|nr:hypothetical protein [Halieaceae bacterium]